MPSKQGALLRDAAVALAALTNELARGVGGRASGGDGRGGGGGSRGGARVQKPPGTGVSFPLPLFSLSFFLRLRLPAATGACQ